MSQEENKRQKSLFAAKDLPDDDEKMRRDLEDLRQYINDREAEQKELLGKIEALEKERDELRNEAARAKADYRNYRARVERDQERDRKLAAERAVETLIPVLDNLDRVVGAVTDKESPIFKGVAMVRNQFVAALTELGAECIGTDCVFDPACHEAIGQADVDDPQKEGWVAQVFQEGYRLAGKIIRPAKVLVARYAGSEAADSKKAED